MIGKWHGDEGPVALEAGALEPFFRGGGGLLLADPLWASAETLQPLQDGGFASIARPAAGAVVMAVADETAPELGDVVIVQADEVAGDAAARKSGDENAIRIAAEEGAEVTHGIAAVALGLVDVSPPALGVLGDAILGFDEGQRGPEDAFAAADAVTEQATFDAAIAGIAPSVGVGAVAGVFDDDGVGLPGLPVGGQMKEVVDLGFFPAGGGLGHSFACGRRAQGHGGHGEVRRDGFPVGLRLRLLGLEAAGDAKNGGECSHALGFQNPCSVSSS